MNPDQMDHMRFQQYSKATLCHWGEHRDPTTTAVAPPVRTHYIPRSSPTTTSQPDVQQRRHDLKKQAQKDPQNRNRPMEWKDGTLHFSDKGKEPVPGIPRVPKEK